MLDPDIDEATLADTLEGDRHPRKTGRPGSLRS